MRNAGAICAGVLELRLKHAEQGLPRVAGSLLSTAELPFQEKREICHLGAALGWLALHAGHHEAPCQPQGIPQGQESELLTLNDL